MNYPLISEYIEAIKLAEDNFKELSCLRPVLGDDGLPIMTSGNFAVIFKMRDGRSGKLYAVKCFTKEQEGRADAYREIAKELKEVSSPYLVSIQYLEKELFVDTDQTTETEFPILLMDWVEGKTLDKYLRENLDDKYALEMLAYGFSLLAQWLIPQPFAHGDLKPDNILVREDGTLVLVDYDGMYVPAMKGQKARELGSPDFRHPLRTENDFNEHIDDFPLASILLSLKAISLNPILLKEFGTFDSLLFLKQDVFDIANSRILRVLLLLCCEKEIERLYSLFLLLHSDIQCKPYLNAISISMPQNPYLTDNNFIQVTKEDILNSHKDEYGTRYSSDNKRLLLGGCAGICDDTISHNAEIICNDAFFKGDDNYLSWEDKVVIPEGIKFIGRNPFAGHLFPIQSLSDHFVVDNGALYTNDKKRLIGLYLNKSYFDIPEGVTHIDDNAFRGHIKLSSISFPSTLKRIGNSAFQDTGLVTVAFPDSLTEIGNSAFEYCYRLKEIRMSSNVNYIGNRAFRRTKAEYIKIPKSTYYIGVGTFEGIDGLNIVLESNLFETDGFALFSKYRKLLLFYYSDKEEYCIPEGVTHICSFAFADKKIRSVLIPQSVSFIDKDAFNSNMISAIYVTKDNINRIKSLLPISVHRFIKEKTNKV